MIIGVLRVGRWAGVWHGVRLGAALFLLWVVASDTGPRLARLQFAALPEFDYAAEVAWLRTAGRYGEALVIADAGLETVRDPQSLAAIQRERDLAEAEQRSLSRRAGEVAMGALSGRGTSIESLVGAVAADFFIVGDVRDLVLESGRYTLDGEADEVILVLSALGLATTLAPYADWAPAVLKFARKTGTLTRGLADHIVQLARTGRRDEVATILGDVRRLSRHASPGGAARLLRHADSAEDLAAMANFVERHRGGAAALHITGREGAALVKGTARATDGGAGAAQAVILASGKGKHGAAWLRTGAWRALSRPHALVGISKGLWKGNVQKLTARVLGLLDPHARWMLPLLAAWVFVELALLGRRVCRRFDSASRNGPRDARSPHLAAGAFQPSPGALEGHGT